MKVCFSFLIYEVPQKPILINRSKKNSRITRSFDKLQFINKDVKLK